MQTRAHCGGAVADTIRIRGGGVVGCNLYTLPPLRNNSTHPRLVKHLQLVHIDVFSGGGYCDFVVIRCTGA